MHIYALIAAGLGDQVGAVAIGVGVGIIVGLLIRTLAVKFQKLSVRV